MQRRLGVALVAVLLATLPGLGGQAPRQALACYGRGCSTPADPPVYTGYPKNTGELLTYEGHAYVYRPGGPRFEGGRPARFSEPSEPAPVVGADCHATFVSPVEWHGSGGKAMGGDSDIWASFPAPPGGWNPWRPEPAITTVPLTILDGNMATLNGADVTAVRYGKYVRNPDGSVTCQLSDFQIWFQPPPCNLVVQTYDICYNYIPRTVLGGPNAVAWGPYAADVANSLNGQAGRVVSSPSLRGVVNTSTCFWVEGMGIPNNVDRLLYLAGPPDAFGRQIFYTFIIHAAFNGIRWVFDDPANNDEAPPAPACGDSTAHPHLSAHQYSTISEGRHPDNRYSVTAYESYVITVDEYWFDQTGLNHVQPVPPIPVQEIHTDPYPQYVVQVEGVPQAS